MKIPKNKAEREQLYDEVILQCELSQNERRPNYETRRSYYLNGAESSEIDVPFNKIYPHLDTITSFLFASESTKFTVNPDVTEKPFEEWRAGIFGRAINELWHNSNSDQIVSSAILWALIYDSMIVKVLPAVNDDTKELQINPYTVHPATFGVYREDLNTLDRQQALVQKYYITEDELAKMLEGHPQAAEIISAMESKQPEEEQNANPLMDVIMGTWQPIGNPIAAKGGVSFDLASNNDCAPVELDKLRELKELWIWDDDLNDYRVVTRPSGGMYSIFDRENIYLPGEHPFVKFTPRPLPFYVWGESECQGLTGLQRWRNEYILWVKNVLDRQLEPPTSISGFGAIEEDAYARFIGGSYIAETSGMPGATVNMNRPPMPQDAYRMLAEIDASFNEYSGLPNTVQGKGEVGVRSAQQANSLARLGSARIKKRSLVIEDTLEKMAYLIARLMQKHSPDVYKDSQGNEFVLDEFTKRYTVKVDAHSNSPVFIEDKRDLAFSMLKDGLITKKRAIEMIDPPDKDVVLKELDELQQGEQQAKQAEDMDNLRQAALKHAPEGFLQKLLAKLFPGMVQ